MAARVVVLATPAAAAGAAAALVLKTIERAARPVVALPTGRTAELLYAALRRRARRRSLARVRVFQLDEFIGLRAADPRTYAAFLRRHLLDHVDVPPANVTWLRTAGHPARVAARYERAIAAAGGFDLAILGIGANGHVAFNEPAPALAAATHVVRLHRRTRLAQQPRFGRLVDVPTQAITVGMGTILRARRIVLVATGKEKAAIVRRAFQNGITTRVPASLLQLHPDVTVVLDAAAAARLRRARPTAV